ncbi:cytochrome c [Mariprofundus ferrinatatus]|uniref:Cytochrome c n=1 Tax=Mariprofundus ferrinatatus TaxID=1921087 RepID=A0A2K8L755_9PROT|nr:cytochrome C [Mariprofundus ferrinatatus]ATX83093.1 cytochrome c [Mariprofundus ferrinatatus]
MKKALFVAAAAAFVMGGVMTAEASALGKCKACHNLDSADKKVGPGLKGIAGKAQGGLEGFKYGAYLEAQNAAGATWTDEALEAWVCDSKGVSGKKTKMPSQKVCGDDAKAAVAELKAL